MGNCFSSEKGEDRMQSDAIDAELQEAQADMQNEVKLLLLGSGESGKSTIFKQMKIIHKDGFNERERKGFIIYVRSNLVTNMKTLLYSVKALNLRLESEAAQQAALRVEQLSSDAPTWTPQVVEDLRLLWQQPGIQQALLQGAKFQLNDSTQYFFENLPRIAREPYLPSDQDILRVRIRTTAAVEMDFRYGGLYFRMTDVGGQRNERRKWIHCFQDVTAILFCVALSEYDQVLVEDATTNRMQESLVLFEEIVNQVWFRSTPVILFLNKEDIFTAKIQRQGDLDRYFPDYTGGTDVKAAKEFILRKFLAKNHVRERDIFYHFTTATDTRNIQHVFEDVRDILFQERLRRSGFF